MIKNGDSEPLGNPNLRVMFVFELFKLLRLFRIKKIMSTSEVLTRLWERTNVEVALLVKFIFQMTLVAHWIGKECDV